MKIKLNDIFSTEVNSQYSNWEELTKGEHEDALLIQLFFYFL